MMQTYLISYDITKDQLRLKAAKLILRSGCYRVQYSVFMGSLKASTIDKLNEELHSLSLKPGWTTEDSIMILPLHQYTRDELELIGKKPENWSLIYQDLHTLVL